MELLMIGRSEPRGHGKDKVYGLNAVDKRFITEKMSLVVTPEANESLKRVAAETMVLPTKQLACVLMQHASRGSRVRASI
jgi:hypothetical protein